jgi:hypothetical protein
MSLRRFLSALLLGAAGLTATAALADVVCIPHCIERYGDGTCKSWGADICSETGNPNRPGHPGNTGPACTPQCVRRYGDGTCAEYGGDFCSDGHGGTVEPTPSPEPEPAPWTPTPDPGPSSGPQKPTRA